MKSNLQFSLCGAALPGNLPQFASSCKVSSLSASQFLQFLISHLLAHNLRCSIMPVTGEVMLLPVIVILLNTFMVNIHKVL